MRASKRAACANEWHLFVSLQGLETIGALDLGGASTQISFVSDNYDGSESPSNSVTFRLYGNDYNLYTHSFLCYGKDQVLRLALAHQTQVNFWPKFLLELCDHTLISFLSYLTLSPSQVQQQY